MARKNKTMQRKLNLSMDEKYPIKGVEFGEEKGKKNNNKIKLN